MKAHSTRLYRLVTLAICLFLLRMQSYVQEKWESNNVWANLKPIFTNPDCHRESIHYQSCESSYSHNES